jgi:hypothetical protein
MAENAGEKNESPNKLGTRNKLNVQVVSPYEQEWTHWGQEKTLQCHRYPDIRNMSLL